LLAGSVDGRGPAAAIAEANAEAAKTPLRHISEEDAFVNEMLEHRDTYLNFEEGNMMCFLTLPERMDGRKYTEEIILKFLKKAKVIYGVDKQAIKKLGQEGKPVIRSLVAVGLEVVNGQNGYYEYFFDTTEEPEPEILRDGTADLEKMKCLQPVKVGDRIALYHRATRGTDGYDVFGNYIKAIPGKEIPILKGTGFMIMNDRVSYVATYTGAIRMVNGRVEITKLMVVQEVKITDKKIKYDGTVFVVGDVFSGSEIEATGDVLIGGHMESSSIISGGNVIIKGGCTCPLRGGVEAKGDVSAKYFEGAVVKGRNITANFFINCEVQATGMLKTYGRAGIIYGGSANSLYGMEVAHLGNKSGVKTIVNIGVNNQILTQYNAICKDLSREEDELNALESEKLRLQELGAGDKRIMQWKIKINAAVSSKELHLKQMREKKEALEAEINKGRGARVKVTEVVYAGTFFIIAGIKLKIEEDRKAYGNLTFKADIESESIVAI
jgi:uncharacterized protein (DUF342 family)